MIITPRVSLWLIVGVFIWPYDGIGRHGGLRIHCWKQRAGSNPARAIVSKHIKNQKTSVSLRGDQKLLKIIGGRAGILDNNCFTNTHNDPMKL